MPKEKSAQAMQVIKQCPSCTAQVFKIPQSEVRIINGEDVPIENKYECVRCHREWDKSEMIDHVVPFVMVDAQPV